MVGVHLFMIITLSGLWICFHTRLEAADVLPVVSSYVETVILMSKK